MTIGLYILRPVPYIGHRDLPCHLAITLYNIVGPVCICVCMYRPTPVWWVCDIRAQYNSIGLQSYIKIIGPNTDFIHFQGVVIYFGYGIRHSKQSEGVYELLGSKEGDDKKRNPFKQ